MNEHKFIELRQQINENNIEYTEFLNDMNNWHDDIAKKNMKLSSSEKNPTPLPPIRNYHLKKKVKHRRHEKATPVKQEKQPRIKSYDYEQWNKLDIDKMLEELDKPEKIESYSSEEETDEELENERRAKLAEVKKHEGNQLFKAGKLSEAIENYTTAIRLAPENAILYSNRAFAMLKSERFASAEADCSTAIAIDPKLAKAFYRRGLARKELEKISEAISDFKSVLKLEPKNTMAAKELKALCIPVIPAVLFKHINVADVDTKNLLKISVVEVGTTFKAEAPKQNKKCIEECRETDNEYLNSTNNRTKNHSLNKSGEIDVLKTPIFPYSTQKKTLSPPSNWFQLERELRELCPSNKTELTTLAIDYLCSIEPTDYSRIIGENLDSYTLSRFTFAIRNATNLTLLDQTNRLSSLTILPRFDVAWLLIDDKTRELVLELITSLRENLPAQTMSYLCAFK